MKNIKYIVAAMGVFIISQVALSDASCHSNPVQNCERNAITCPISPKCQCIPQPQCNQIPRYTPECIPEQVLQSASGCIPEQRVLPVVPACVSEQQVLSSVPGCIPEQVLPSAPGCISEQQVLPGVPVPETLFQSTYGQIPSFSWILNQLPLQNQLPPRVLPIHYY